MRLPARGFTFVVAVSCALTVAAIPAEPAFAQAPSRVRFTAPEGQSLLVRGEYPPVQSSCVEPYQPLLHARYRGTIEVARAADGSLSLIGELSFEDYIKGIAEVPRDWPMEALKAQVVAARTYALNRFEFAATSGDWDLCATTECQVYVGMEVEAGPWGDRWVRAVDQTAQQVLLYEGQPAITYYSSTSPGRTFDVEDRFGGEALPYLRGTEENDDGASPLSRWRVEVPFDDLARFLAAEGLWSGGRISSVTAGEGQITIAGADRVAVSKDGLRDALNDIASCLAPDRYPTYEADGYRLPQTVPSIWYRVEQEGSALVLIGRGWGHGIGMVQWGAYGKAKRGLSYGDILAAYYGGLTPQRVDLPGTIRILIADGLRRIVVAPSADDATVEPSVEVRPPWVVTSGERLRVRHGAPPPPILEASALSGPNDAVVGAPYRGRVELSDDASVRLELLQRGEVAATTAWEPFEDGIARPRAALPAVPPGRYRVRAAATNGVDTVLTPARPVVVAGDADTPPVAASPQTTPTTVADPPADDGSGRRWLVVGGIAAAVVLVLILLLTAGRRKGLHRA
jgi:SpoIID/LytB domain protein